jgi:hypothetical protein
MEESASSEMKEEMSKAQPKIEVDGGTPGLAHILSGNCLRRAALRGSSWRVITMRTEPWGRKARSITDITSTALKKEEMSVYL